MAKVITDPTLGTLMNITNKYEVWIKGPITTKIRINNEKKNKKKKGKN